jgi:DNA-binding GntR family transcriptional regulator
VYTAARGPARVRTRSPEAAYLRLRSLIVTLKLAPGARLTEAEVCATLGAPRTAVRLALQRLQQEGL